jgi:hypothetical protein
MYITTCASYVVFVLYKICWFLNTCIHLPLHVCTSSICARPPYPCGPPLTCLCPLAHNAPKFLFPNHSKFLTTHPPYQCIHPCPYAPPSYLCMFSLLVLALPPLVHASLLYMPKFPFPNHSKFITTLFSPTRVRPFACMRLSFLSQIVRSSSPHPFPYLGTHSCIYAPPFYSCMPTCMRPLWEPKVTLRPHMWLTPKIPSVFLTNFCSFWPSWRNPFLYQKKNENLRK